MKMVQKMNKKETAQIKQQATKSLNEISDILFSIVEYREHRVLKNLPICPFIFSPSGDEKEGSFVFEITRTPESNCGGVYGYSSPTTYYFDTTLAALIEAQEAMLMLMGGVDNALNLTFGGVKDIHYISLRNQLNSSQLSIEYEFRNHDDQAENYDEDMKRCYQYPVFIEGISNGAEKGYSGTDMKKVLDVLTLFRRFELLKYAFDPRYSFLSTLKGAIIGDNYISGVTMLKVTRMRDAALKIKEIFDQVNAEREELFSK